MKRMRGRNHRSGGGGGGFRNQQNGIPLNRNHVFDSSGPEMRVRGTAQQLFDKYTQLARDAASSADRVLSEAYYQHAEHYFRVLSAINAAQGLPPPGQSQNSEARYNNPHQGGDAQRRESAEGEAQEGREPRQERQDNRESRQERRFEPRQRQDFQPRERQERQERQYRPAAPIADTPIDISSALEAELRAASQEEPVGLGEQPEVKPEAKQDTAEPRAIPIVADAPPANAPELTLTEPAAPAPKRRGRPPRGKTTPKTTKATAAEKEKAE
ncbi:protein of unknown function [Acidocella aminolytica 101 = DSM 11237]|nr:protein of unknown function [Acidocella aminolytica 101 = DSM 11237]